MLLLLLQTAAAQPYLHEHNADATAVVAAYADAMQQRGLKVRPSVQTLLADAHPALPLTVELAFSGSVVVGIQETDVSGILKVQRTGASHSTAELSFTDSRTPRAEKRLPKVAAALKRDADARAPNMPVVEAPSTDPLLSDPQLCEERLEVFVQSPYPAARALLLGALDYTAPRCRRPLVAALLTDEQGKSAVSDWLVASYGAADDAEKSKLMPLVFQVPEPNDALRAVLAEDEARWD